jgi:hypothetical protein
VAGTAKNFDVTRLQQGPGDLWIIGGGVVDSATPQLTLAVDGTPDSVAHPLSIHLGATDAGIAWATVPKFDDIGADQFDGPLTRYVQEQQASIEAELKQIDMAIMQQCQPYLTFSSAAGYKQLTGGGQVTLAAPCVALISPKLGAAGKFYVCVLFKAHGVLGVSLTFQRSKAAMYKAQFKGLVDPARTAGRQMFVQYETV